MEKSKIKFVDLFAGIGGIRKGLELACKDLELETECVLTSEIKESAIKVLKQNHPSEEIAGDIKTINEKTMPDFDILLAGFPCQSFSSAGKRLGFEDTRGTLFFEVARILKEKQPYGFILENVEGLVTHNKENKNDEIGKTFSKILNCLNELNYKVEWKILNASDFGIPQERKRVYIVGTKIKKINLNNFEKHKNTLDSILENGLPTTNTKFTSLLLSHYDIKDLYGKSIKDKRGGKNNIHSWDIEYKGKVSKEERNLLNTILKERRKKKWAEEIGIDWMDGMPLTYEQIKTFFKSKNLKEMLEDLEKKGYLKKEYPKKKVGNKRIPNNTLPKGYNIVAGKMSFEIAKILDPKENTPTLVAMDMQHLYVVDKTGLRPLSLREGLRLFGYPDDYKFNVTKYEGYDLLGNTVVVPVIKQVAIRLLNEYKKEKL